MTVNTEVSEETFIGNGVTTQFPLAFRFFKDSDLKVKRLQDSTGGAEDLVLGADYSVSGANNASGGSVTLLRGPLGVGYRLNVERILNAVQDTSFINQGTFFPEVHEKAFDYLTMLFQQAYTLLNRSLRRPSGRNFYDAEARQIKNVVDPVDDQDAATRKWTSTFLASLVNSLPIGPVSSASSVIYTRPDGQAGNLQQLSGPMGSRYIGHDAGTVEDKLDQLETAITGINATVIPYSQNSGVRALNVGAALDLIGRSGREGLFRTVDIGHRAGILSYRIERGGQVSLVSDLSRHLPAGYADTPESVLPTGRRAYYVSLSGNDSNAGTSWAAPLLSISAALAKTDVDVVFVGPGTYLDTTNPPANGGNMGTYSGIRDVAIIGIGAVYLINAPIQSSAAWSTTAQANVYTKNVPSADYVGGMVALNYRDEFGLPLLLQEVLDINLVQVTPGSYFRGTGAVFVRLPDNAQPHALLTRFFGATTQIVSSPGTKVFFKNITFIGGDSASLKATAGSASSVVALEKCKLLGSRGGNPYTVEGIGLSIAIDCVGANSGNDIYNYHGVGALSPHFIEVNCVGVLGKRENTGNGSTAHEACRGYRFGCDYAFNGGPGVADINDAQTYNVGVTSRSNGPSTSATGFTCSAEGATGGGAKMWLHACSTGDNSGADVRATTSGAIMVRDTHYRTVSETSGGTVTSF